MIFYKGRFCGHVVRIDELLGFDWAETRDPVRGCRHYALLPDAGRADAPILVCPD